jgi:son of sevenless-like protein
LVSKEFTPEPAEDYSIEQKGSIKLPDNWAIKTTKSFRNYDLDALKTTHRKVNGRSDLGSEGQDEAIVYTWTGLSIFIVHRIKVLNQTIIENIKELFVTKTAFVIEAIQMLFHCSNIEELDTNKYYDLKQGQLLIKQLISQLILASKLSSTLWPPPESNDLFLETSVELLKTIRKFTTDGILSRVTLTEATHIDLALFNTKAISLINDHQIPPNNMALVQKLEKEMLQIITIIEQFHLTKNEMKILYSPLPLNITIQKCNLLIQTVHSYFKLINDLHLDSLFKDLVVDFKLNQISLLNTLTEFSERFQSKKGPDFVYILLVEKAARELLISTRFLVEEKEMMEVDTLNSFINNYSVPGDNAAIGLRKAASMSFKNTFDKFVDEKNVKIEAEPESSLVDEFDRLSFNMSRQSSAFSKSGSFRSSLVDLEVFDENLVMKGDEVKGGSVEGFFSYLSSHDNDHYIDTFFLTYRVFTTSEKLLEDLKKRFNAEDISDDKQRKIRTKVHSIIKLWLDRYIHDDEMDRAIVLKIKLFAELEMKQSIVPLYMHIGKAILLQLDSLEVARQLTIFENNLYLKIDPNELLIKSWNLEGEYTNLMKMINVSIKLKNWTIQSILNSKKQIKTIAFFISVANVI